jgi:hypothetical protein
VGEGKGTKERERVVRKTAGDKCVFILEGSSWQMKPGSDAIPDAAGGEGGHGAAKPDGVIQRSQIYYEERGHLGVPNGKSNLELID